jgi:hypothetical protein
LDYHQKLVEELIGNGGVVVVPDGSMKELLASSGLVFTGTVSEAGATSISGVPVDERTAIVQLSELLKGPAGMTLPPGSAITVQLSSDLPILQPGDQATFFTNAWIYGETLAVTEVGRMPVEAGAARTATLAGRPAPITEAEAALAELAQDEVLEHARAADAVVRGQVISLAQVPGTRAPREHDPDWWIATLAVDLVAKGQVPNTTEGVSTVGVLYANSQDISWRESLKPKASQAGLWLLHRTTGETESLAPFQVSHALDLQPSVQLDFLRQQGL